MKNRNIFMARKQQYGALPRRKPNRHRTVSKGSAIGSYAWKRHMGRIST